MNVNVEQFKFTELLSHPKEHFKYFNNPNIQNVKRISLSSKNNSQNKPTSLTKPTSANDIIELKRGGKPDINNYMGGNRSNSINKTNLAKTMGAASGNNNFKINHKNRFKYPNSNELDNSTSESPKRNNPNIINNDVDNEKNLFNTFRNRNSKSNSKLLAIGHTNRQQLPSIGSNSNKTGYPRDTFSSGYSSRGIPLNPSTNISSTTNISSNNKSLNPLSNLSNMFSKSLNPNKFNKASYSSNYIPEPNLGLKNIEKINAKKPYTSSKLIKSDSKSYVTFDSSSCVKDYALKDEQNAPYRSYMEDYMKVTPNFLGDSSKIVFGLYDGHGGDQVAKIAKDRLPELFAKNLSEPKNTVEMALTNSFRRMDDLLKKHENVGSTACLAYICNEDGKRVIYSANVGDSRTVLIRRRKAERLSYDHKGTDQKEIERVKISGGVVFGGRVFGQLAISRAFGDFSLKSYGVIAIPYISKSFIEDNDSYVVIGSDGIWDVIDEDFVYKLSQNVHSSEELVRSIVNNAMSLGSIDNISCIVIKLN